MAHSREKEQQTEVPDTSVAVASLGAILDKEAGELGFTLKDEVLNKLNPPIHIRPNDESSDMLDKMKKTPKRDRVVIYDCTGTEKAITKEEFRGLIFSLHRENIYDYEFNFEAATQAIEDCLLNEYKSTIAAMKHKPKNVLKYRQESSEWQAVSSFFDDFLNLSSEEYRAKCKTHDAQRWVAIEKYLVSAIEAKGKRTSKSKPSELLSDIQLSQLILTQLDEIRVDIKAALKEDMEGYLKKHSSAAPKDVEDHIVSSAKDCIALWAPIPLDHEQTSQPASTDSKTKLLYKGTLSKLVGAIRKYAYVIGYQDWNFSFYQLSFNTQAEFISFADLARMKRSKSDDGVRSESPSISDSSSRSTDSEDAATKSETKSAVGRSEPIQIPSPRRERRTSSPDSSSAVKKNSPPPPTTEDILHVAVLNYITEENRQNQSLLLCSLG